jgi:hypothetical protein
VVITTVATTLSKTAASWSLAIMKYRRGKEIMRLKKGKAVPLEALSGPESSKKLRFPDFMTTAQDGGKVVSLTHRPP